MSHPHSLRINDDKMVKELRRVAAADRVSVSDVHREALRRYLAVRRLESITAKITKRAAAQGIITGEDFERAAVDSVHRNRR